MNFMFVSKNADTSELSELPYRIFSAMNVYPSQTLHFKYIPRSGPLSQNINWLFSVARPSLPKIS